jgi:glutathione-regulated potassium-efflux system protein KefB
VPFLHTLVILLLAAVLSVPLARRLGFGSVLGYLGAGLLIGPAGLALVSDVESIAQVSELGVVMLLFIIGLELRPQRLWTMRRSVMGLGAAQVVVTTVALAFAAYHMGLAWQLALVAGFALSLSSTAIVLPMLSERDLLTNVSGRDAFAVLLFQDMAVIPALAFLPLLSGGVSGSLESIGIAVAKALGALAVVLIGGRFLIRPIFRAVDAAKTPEIFTATALLIVAGTAFLVDTVGLSMSLGAFMAGVLLSDSEYRHEIRADIEPFEGLLLGIFFISVGMSANLGLLLTEPGMIVAGVAGLLIVKFAISFALAKLFEQPNVEAVRFGFALPQAGEFGFVLFAAAVANGIMSTEQSEMLMLLVTLSMVASPLLFWGQEKFLVPLFERAATRPYDEITARNPVIICGFGRVGQIVGRILRMQGIAFTALDNSAEQVDQVRRFGATAYYGDSARLDLLRAAGAEEARIIVVALEDVNQSLAVVEHAQRHFPHLVVFARARNRRHAHLLMDRGVTHIVRETFYSSLKLTEQVMRELGTRQEDIEKIVSLFKERDERALIESHSYYDDETQLIQTTKQVAEELRGILESDAARKGEEAGPL